MLVKLLKHEFKATSRQFLLLYAVFAAVTLCNKIVLEITSFNEFWSTFQGLFMGVYVLTCAIIFVMTTVLIVMRFYRNMVKDEGYLTFTLPVSVHELLLSKAIAAFVWMLASFLIFLVSVMLLTWGHGVTESIAELAPELFNAYPELSACKSSAIVFCILYIVNLIIGSFYSIFMIYMSIAIGQLVNKHRVLTSIGAFFGISFIIQNVLSILFVALSFFFASTDMFDAILYTNSTEAAYFFFRFLNGTLLISMFLNLILTAGFYFVTNYIFSKKLNLE